MSIGVPSDAAQIDPDDRRMTIRQLSDRLLEIQRPIRVLDAVHWDDRIRAAFLTDPTAMPDVDVDYYASRPLGFDPVGVRAQLTDLAGDVGRLLPAGRPETELLARSCEQYLHTIDLLAHRGRPRFGDASVALYGHPDDEFHAGGPSVRRFGAQLGAGLAWLDGVPDADDGPTLPGHRAVEVLQAQLDRSMGPGLVQVVADDGIVADAAAGATVVKLRSDAVFGPHQLDQLEAHEGWVHVGTTLNGLRQPWCTFLGRATPPTTVTQEGLATLTEIVSMRSHPERLRRIADRIEGIGLAADGATFPEVAEHFRTAGRSIHETWALTARIFRGSLPDGPPFTKDLAYGKGLVLTYGYVRVAAQQGRPDRIPMLFAGKFDLADLGLVNRLVDDGLVAAPLHVPAPFRDPAALIASMVFSRFLRDLDFDVLTADYAELL